MAIKPGMASPEDPPEATIHGEGLEMQDGTGQLGVERCTVVERDDPGHGHRSDGQYSEKRRLPIEEPAVARLPAEVIEK